MLGDSLIKNTKETVHFTAGIIRYNTSDVVSPD